ncbi:hybrid sensor histidine kinase/response regulator [Vibrio breoganii]|uniref:hybrid sensor histidine kinase/response regulator n=1 Tax=Vibrio breoganii TaxID=553239 RepID=UPI00080EBC81|nr:NahK/ErcS family hybrid sensor histidine kinase/response regulator [Vibrio breoganii]OCH73196.1 hybrid sensor histidine kinase/response regulator [Vibrio breoganii]
MQGWVVVPASLLYLVLLFLVAWYGDKRPQWLASWRPWIYSLSIAVYCTSWTFFGTVGQAANNPWAFLPVYLAPIIVFVFFWRVLARMILVAKREHINSIADFIAARYGKSQGLAVFVTLISVVGILPYIALQMRGIMMGIELAAPEVLGEGGNQKYLVSWLMVAALATFTVLFGTRHIDNTEHHRGMMMAIAFESIVKLVAFLFVGIFVMFVVLQRTDIELWQAAKQTYESPNIPTLLIHTLLTMMAIFCLPRQFHTTVVENERAHDLHTARRVFPAYLMLMGLFVLPIAWVGSSLLPGSPADSYVISLPLALGADSVALFAFIGGVSAASGMVIVSTIALAIMVSNDLVMPLLLRRMKLSQHNFRHFSGRLLVIRRILIVMLIVGAWFFYQVLDSIGSLSAIGFLSFAAVTQFAPALLGGMYWRHGNRNGVYVGLVVGFVLWLVTLMSQTGILAGDAGNNVLIWMISPPELLARLDIKNSDWGMLLSISANSVCYVVVSILTRPNISERLQSAAFVGSPLPESDNISLYQSRVTVAELELVASKFVGRHRVRSAFNQFWSQQEEVLMPNQYAPSTLIRHTERVLAGVFGASSAKLVLTSALQGKNMQLEEVATIVDEASELYDFSRSLLQGAIEHIEQGIAVVDKQLRLVAWNQRYLELFEFPPGLIQVGRPIADVIRHNAEKGLCGPGDPEVHVQRRLEHLRRGTNHTSSRQRADGRVIEVQGNPMPSGGFAMSFSDITVYRQAEQALKDANVTLEERVQERTHELEQLNRQLTIATQRSEQESQSKSRFLAAVSHDLMQPLNAARLFTSSLSEVAKDAETQQVARHIESAMEAAEVLISDLLDISRLESGKLEAKVQPFALSEVLFNLDAEFGVIAEEQGINFRTIPTSLFVESDPKLLRRVIQNFLTNAFRYSPQGKVILGARREGNTLSIQVWDNGVGVEEDKQQLIFEEFTRTNQIRSDKGLGLGLAISKGIAQLLGHTISLRSWPSRGSVFSITVPLAQKVVVEEVPSIAPVVTATPLSNLRVLCVDDEVSILEGMEHLLQRWGCQVRLATDLEQSLLQLDNHWQPDVILSDYRLENGRTGLQVLQHFKQVMGTEFNGVIISADRTPDIVDQVKSEGFEFLPKPVKPLKLRTLLNNFERHLSSVNRVS